MPARHADRPPRSPRWHRLRQGQLPPLHRQHRHRLQRRRRRLRPYQSSTTRTSAPPTAPPPSRPTGLSWTTPVCATFTNTNSLFLKIDGLQRHIQRERHPRRRQRPRRRRPRAATPTTSAAATTTPTSAASPSSSTRATSTWPNQALHIVFNDTAGTAPDTYHLTSNRFSKRGPQTDPYNFQVFNPRNDSALLTGHWPLQHHPTGTRFRPPTASPSTPVPARTPSTPRAGHSPALT